MTYLLRIELPDRPGALGAVATELGKVGADILSMDIVERSLDTAVDDIVVTLPSGRQPDELITAAERLPGVRVESVRPDPGVATRHREWQLVEAIAAEPKEALTILARMLPQVLQAGWAIVARVDEGLGGQTVEVLAGGGGVPDLTGVTPGWAPVRHAALLNSDAAWVPADWRAIDMTMAVAPLWDANTAVIVGRSGGPAIRDSEVARLAHLAGLASVVSGRAPVAAYAGVH